MSRPVILPVNSLADAQREIEKLARWLDQTTGSGGGSGGGSGTTVDMATQAELDAAIAAINRKASVKGEIWNYGSVIVAQDSSKIRSPFDFTITAAEITADVAGSITIEVYRSTYGTWNTFDKLSASSPITLTIQKKNQTSLTGWTTAIKEGDYLMFRVVGVPNLVTEVTATLSGVKA